MSATPLTRCDGLTPRLALERPVSLLVLATPMNSDAPTPSPTGSSLVDDWPTLSNDLLQGLVHALNNRVSALGAFMELARLRDERVDPWPSSRPRSRSCRR